MEDDITDHPREDDRNDELNESPVPDPEATELPAEEGDPEAD
jgi:hypothetical protein